MFTLLNLGISMCVIHPVDQSGLHDHNPELSHELEGAVLVQTFCSPFASPNGGLNRTGYNRVLACH